MVRVDDFIDKIESEKMREAELKFQPDQNSAMEPTRLVSAGADGSAGRWSRNVFVGAARHPRSGRALVGVCRRGRRHRGRRTHSQKQMLAQRQSAKRSNRKQKLPTHTAVEKGLASGRK
eukprot:GHVT01086838.1.p1 GENE.GHVT01086838.1~~GHVT01086838.1.p1  ORF type:complete len:119 (+),score=20.39 GHVT01086838.1:1141-1497(+)